MSERKNTAKSQPNSVRLSVPKTYKLYIDGKFPRSESGRSYQVHDAAGNFLANAARASRKDLRDAVVAARKAFAGWSAATGYNRGQVIYRVAEMLSGRSAQFVAEVAASEGVPTKTAQSIVDTSIDRLVWYAGWTDKLAAVFGAANPVAGPYFSFSVPEPTGIIGVLAPQKSSLLGLVSVLAPTLAGGNTCVLIASQAHPLPAITLAEVLATSDVPAGVVNILTGYPDELGQWLASHADVNALDLVGAQPKQRAELERAAAETVKRIVRAGDVESTDWADEPDLRRLRAGLETKTVWHPIGV
ncbi:MAG: aldehyde dehydrogenase family protein [Sciscionella sp.]|nr:aldehyde dehydrogenase family protein [Sciscionella sp.]